jgi:hypothetical protein
MTTAAELVITKPREKELPIRPQNNLKKHEKKT